MEQVKIFRSIGDLVFDATFVEDHNSDLEVTDNPIETGSLVSDHAFMKPLRLSITAGVSAVLLPSGNPDFGTGDERPTTAYELLSLLQQEREPFDVQTGLRIYENMMCLNFGAQQTKDSAGIFYFTANLREVLIVDTETTTYPPRKSGATAQQASKTKNKGEQQGKTDSKTGNDGAKKSSLLSSAVNAFKGVTGSPPASAKK
jgi:hypothetical protein